MQINQELFSTIFWSVVFGIVFARLVLFIASLAFGITKRVFAGAISLLEGKFALGTKFKGTAASCCSAGSSMEIGGESILSKASGSRNN